MILNSIEEVKKFINDYDIKFFKAEEFVCPCCGKVKIDSELILKLETLRHKLLNKIIITSAYRCPKHNKEVGGIKNSEHLEGKAVDIKVIGSVYRYHIIKTIFENGIDFRRIGIAKDFIHLGIDDKKPQNVIWLY